METHLTRLLNNKLQEKFDGNASELARVLGTSQQNISNWMNGDVVKPSYWKRGAAALGLTEEQVNLAIREDVGNDRVYLFVDHLSPDHSSINEPKKKRGFQMKPEYLNLRQPKIIPNATIMPTTQVVTTNKMLPVLGMAVGGDDGRYIFNGSIIDYVVCPPSLENVAGAYAVYIDGESMYPRFKAGETVWVHPGKPARRGDDVIVQIKPTDDDGSPPWGYVKEYVGRQGNSLVLRQYNPPIEIQFDVNDVLTTHPIVLAGKY